MLQKPSRRQLQRPYIQRADTYNDQEISHYDDLLATVKKRKLEWYGHMKRETKDWPRPFCRAPPEQGEKEEDSESDGMTISESGQA